MRIYYCVLKSPSLALILSQMNPVHILISYFFNIHFNVALQSMPFYQLWITTAVKLSSDNQLFNREAAYRSVSNNFPLCACQTLLCLSTPPYLFYLWRNNPHPLSGLSRLLQSAKLLLGKVHKKFPGSASIRHKTILSHKLLWHTK